MAEITKTNYLYAKSLKKYAVLKKTALKTDSGWWSYAWLKKNHFTIKLFWSESLL